MVAYPTGSNTVSNYFKNPNCFDDKVIGMPIQYHLTDLAPVKELIAASTPMVFITPGIPKYSPQTGFTLYNFLSEGNAAEKDRRYSKIIKTTGVDFNVEQDLPLKVAFCFEGGFTESLGSTYHDSRFEDIKNMGIPFLSELKFITGKDNSIDAAKEAFGSISKAAKGAMGEDSKLLAAMQSIGGGISSMGSSAMKTAENLIGKDNAKQLVALLENSDIDFPAIWGGSSFSASRSITVKLVNPFPNDDDYHRRFIVEPAAKLLSLGCAISDSASTYSYPPIVKVECPGLFYMSSGYATIEINKGGNENDISFSQRVNTLELQISFNGLYESMIAITEEYDKDTAIDKDRPTLKRYIESLSSKFETRNWHNFTQEDEKKETKNETRPYSKPTESTPKTERVSTVDKDLLDKLNSLMVAPSIIPG